ncbi:hypothetical protein WA026_023268 [Henosepilachna vigintioctopunctata]|uniref:Kazal-like domain-containing protein n=1 Tax=Henosepilachna vigintioctopunctata TaxID=420089 RepID=A0AAW1UVP5_9CUCU
MSKLFVFLLLGICIAVVASSPPRGGSSTDGFKQCKKKCSGGHLNPVCGTDGDSYPNIEVLQCYKGCGRNVELASRGFCKKDLPPSQRH